MLHIVQGVSASLGRETWFRFTCKPTFPFLLPHLHGLNDFRDYVLHLDQWRYATQCGMSMQLIMQGRSWSPRLK